MKTSASGCHKQARIFSAGEYRNPHYWMLHFELLELESLHHWHFFGCKIAHDGSSPASILITILIEFPLMNFATRISFKSKIITHRSSKYAFVSTQSGIESQQKNRTFPRSATRFDTPSIRCDTGMAQSVWIRTNCANCSHRRICITHLNNTTSRAKAQNKHSKSAAHPNDNCRTNTRNNVLEAITGRTHEKRGKKLNVFLANWLRRRPM